MSEEQKSNPVIQEVEAMYPEMTKEFKKILREQYELFCKKQSNYGPSNISLGGDLKNSAEDRKFSQTGLWFRMNDKIQRLKQLVIVGKEDNVGESVTDTYQDLSIYGVIAQLVQSGKWGR